MASFCEARSQTELELCEQNSAIDYEKITKSNQKNFIEKLIKVLSSDNSEQIRITVENLPRSATDLCDVVDIRNKGEAVDSDPWNVWLEKDVHFAMYIFTASHCCNLTLMVKVI